MAVDWGKVAAGAGTGAGVGSVAGPWGTAGGAIVGGGAALLDGLFGSDDEAKQAAAAEYAAGQGSGLTNHLAALDYSEGLSQQQGQNAREAGFYGDAQGNFDIGNAAQLRDAPQVQKNAEDERRQLDALTRTNQAIGKTAATGDYLTELGRRPMGDSYAEAQMRQGQQAAMAQQLAMARSGRSLGSGQAAMGQAAFNNAALNQQTNQAAAGARIQEQNAYNQFQANALGQAGNQYGTAGTLAGQAGNQSTTVRQGNEGIQKTNADLTQNQETVNNQTTGLYNSLGVQQQGLGMDANKLGTNAYQFGATQGANKQQGQLNANVGQTSSTTAVNMANADAGRADKAGTLNQITTGAGVIADNAKDWGSGGGSGGGAPSPTGAMAQSTNEAFKNITTASHAPDSQTPVSDAKNKTNVEPLDAPPAYGSPEFQAWATQQEKDWSAAHPRPKSQGTTEAADYSRASQAYHNKLWAAPEPVASDPNDPNRVTFTKADGTKEELNIGKPMDDQDAGKVAVTGEGGINPDVANYLQTINALNAAYRPSQSAPADILNNVPGAGAGHSASQQSVIDRMLGKKAPNVRDIAANADFARMDGPGPKFTRQPTAGAASASAPAPAPAKWSDVFKPPALDYRVQNYLAGQDQYTPPTPGPGTPVTAAPVNVNPNEYRGSEAQLDKARAAIVVPQVENEYRGGRAESGAGLGLGDQANRPSDIFGKQNIVPIGSDEHSKSRIRELEGQLNALGGAGGETTRLPSDREGDFKQWLGRNKVNDLDNPESHYDYRGAYLAGEGRGAGSGHFTDRFKQHGHPTFSIESQYSKNANDGGTWEGERFSPPVRPRAPDLEALDRSEYGRQVRPEGVDFRNARGYSYDYKNPNAPGATPGRQVGTMAQELEQTDGAPYVHDTPRGKVVDTSRLPLALAPAIGHTQRRVDDLEKQLDALKGAGFGGYRPELYPRLGGSVR